MSLGKTVFLIGMLTGGLSFATEPQQASPVEKPREVGLVHVDIRDIPAALDWLEKNLGWRPVYRDEHVAVVPAGSIKIVLDAADADVSARIALVSEDVDADYGRFLDRGAISLAAPRDQPHGSRTAVIKGPGALSFELEGPLTGPTTGFVYTEIKAGTGASPTAEDTVKVRYVGTLQDGTVFGGTRANERPAMFPLNSVIRCWVEGIQKMKVGGKARFVCPPSSAYGLKGLPPKIPPNATLFYEVELTGIAE